MTAPGSSAGDDPGAELCSGGPAEHPAKGAPGGFGPAGAFGPRRRRGGVLGLGLGLGLGLVLGLVLGLGRRGGGFGVSLGVVLADVQVEERPGGVPEPAERAREAGHVILLG